MNPFRRPRQPRRPCRSGAFTGVELLIVVTLVALLVALCLPAFQRVLVSVRGNAMVSDFRVFDAAFTQYATANGTYPPSYTTAGGFPPTMAGLINPSQWTRISPIGGNYAFLKDNTIGGRTYRALIRVRGTGATAITFTSAQMLRIDRKFDNGDLTSGHFFTNGAALNTYYVVEQ